jgi:outer membrane receptor protein involved in Fe transport
MKKVLLFIPVVLFINVLFAQEKTEKIDTLQEVVITGSKIFRSKGNVTQQIDVIDKEEIEKSISGKRNLSELIQYQTGAAVSVLSRNDANWGSYGGIGPKYSTYMLNGLPVDAFIDGMTLSPLILNRMEIQRGPASVMYPNYLSQDFAGNQSPLSGTVNLILKDTIGKPMIRIGADYGSYNTINGYGYHQNHIGGLHFFAGASYEKSDYTNYGSENSWLNMIDNPQYQKIKVFLGGTFLPGNNDKQKISVFANQTLHSGDAGRPNRGFDHNYTIINAGYSFKINDNALFQLSAGLRNYDRKWQEDKYSTATPNTDLRETDGVTQQIIPVATSLSYKHGNNSLLTVGADFQQAAYKTWGQPVDMAKTTGNDAKSMQTGLFVQEEYNIEKLVVRGGIRYNFTQDEITLLGGSAPANKKQSWNSVLWSAGLKYNLNTMITPFINVGTSFITPGLKSIGGTVALQYKDSVGHNGQLPNPDLKPENGIGFDAGIVIKTSEKLTFTARQFMNAINDAIIDNVVSQNPSQTQSINAGKTMAYGLELGVNHKYNKLVEWFANATYTHTEISNPKDADQDGSEVPFVPAFSSNAGFTVNFPKDIHVSYTLHLGGQIYDSSSKTGRTKFNSYELMNVSAWMTVYKMKSGGIDIYTQLYNITDNKFEMPWQFRDPGFSASGGVRITF